MASVIKLKYFYMLFAIFSSRQNVLADLINIVCLAMANFNQFHMFLEKIYSFNQTFSVTHTFYEDK